MSLKVAKVVELDAASCRVRVLLEDEDAMLSWWLPVMQPRTHGDQVYWMPDLGEFAVCLFDERAEFGVLLGSIYSAAGAPPIASLEQLHVAFKDGTTISYDRAAHQLAVSVAGGGSVQVSAETVTVDVPEGGQVFVGTAGEGARLATEHFVEDIYLSHKHATPTGLSGPPLPIGSPLAEPNVTVKLVGS